jgi:hypothetical protein
VLFPEQNTEGPEGIQGLGYARQLVEDFTQNIRAKAVEEYTADAANIRFVARDDHSKGPAYSQDSHVVAAVLNEALAVITAPIDTENTSKTEPRLIQPLLF